MVGAVVLDADGRMAGEGYHRQAGLPHAEEEGLASAGERSRDGTLYVNLEPCAHEHRSPSCAQAVIGKNPTGQPARPTEVVAVTVGVGARVTGTGATGNAAQAARDSARRPGMSARISAVSPG